MNMRRASMQQILSSRATEGILKGLFPFSRTGKEDGGRDHRKKMF
jgi:hypothetical protein